MSGRVFNRLNYNFSTMTAQVINFTPPELSVCTNIEVALKTESTPRGA